jgi:DNA-binding transcriptional MerR regulator
MTDARYRVPNEVATQLQVSPSTLRRWSNEFADYLSDTAGRSQSETGGQASHRRYTDEDLETLMTVKGLLAEGLTYIQVGKRLEALRLRDTVSEVVTDDEGPEITVLGPSLQQSSTAFPAVTVLADTLHTVANGQQMLLGSQQANRDLLSVVLQDNFNLKEENAKLRDRMLELERDMAEIRRLDATRRETLEARMQDLEGKISHRPQPQAQPRPAASAAPTKRSERSGCLAQIFGP